MTRRLVNLAAAVSLGMMLAVVTLWVRSYWRTDSLAHVARKTSPPGNPDARREVEAQWSFMSSGGQLLFHYSDSASVSRVVTTQGFHLNGWSYLSSPTQQSVLHASYRIFGFAGFETGFVSRDAPRSRSRVLSFLLPYWMPVALIGLPLSIVTVKRIRRRRALTGTCEHCGYDLRATPDRCPECGMAVATKPAEAAA